MTIIVIFIPGIGCRIASKFCEMKCETAFNLTKKFYSCEKCLFTAVKKRIYWINEIGGHGWPADAYVVDWTLYVIEWIISQLENKDTVFIQLNIMLNCRHMRLATRNRQFVWLNKLFFSVCDGKCSCFFEAYGIPCSTALSTFFSMITFSDSGWSIILKLRTCI